MCVCVCVVRSKQEPEVILRTTHKHTHTHTPNQELHMWPHCTFYQSTRSQNARDEALISPYSVVIFYQSTRHQNARDDGINFSLFGCNVLRMYTASVITYNRHAIQKQKIAICDPRLTDNLVHRLPHTVIKLCVNVQGLCKDNARLLVHDFSQCTYFFGT